MSCEACEKMPDEQNPPKHADAAVHADGSVTVDDGCCKMKKRSPKEYRDLVNRLSRIEGQIRGIRRMIEEDAYCPDVLRQSSAAAAALNSFNKVLLASHIKTCVADDIRNGKDESINELVNMLQKMMK
ncbi:metal-sensing transcriptional repressor [Eubacterium sp. F2]|uniref:metal-sensing transcriptional repressor n=1 Tax=Eubacterium sp. F2 TaxID=3381348 RepID=UPI003907E8CB